MNYIGGFVRSVEQLSQHYNLELLMLDNGSSDGSFRRLQQEQQRVDFPVHLERFSENRGTTRSRNQLLRRAQGKFIIVADSDVEFTSHGFAEFLKYAREQQKIGILAPRLRLASGDVQASVKHYPTFFGKLRHLIGIMGGHQFKPADRYTDFPFTDTREVETAISAFWLLRREVLEQVGLLDEKIFYAPEDVDYCVRVQKAGYRVVYHPVFEVTHFTQQVTHQSPFSRIAVTHFRDLLYYFRKHHYWNDPELLRRDIHRKIGRT